tara:strand:+ start:2149 stop:3300 length:1152 start_codon:yes stop_codon:yes gene_type:complete
MTTVDFAASLFKHYRNYLWSITGTEYTKLVWSDENIIPKPTEEDLTSKYNQIMAEKTFTQLRRRRDRALTKTDKYTVTDWPHSNLNVQQDRFDQRQTLRDLPTLVSPIEDNLMNVWVTNQNGTLQSRDGLIASNISGYFTKGEPSVVTIKDACDFSDSTTHTYYSNIVSVTQHDELSYYTSNTISHYAGNVISHYSNVIVYDDVNVYTNVEIGEYSNLEAGTQSDYTAVMKSNTSTIEIEGYTPVLIYSNISSDQYVANVHTDYVKVVTTPISNVVEYSNITATKYGNLNSNLIVTPAYTSFYHEVSNTSIRVEAYAALTPDQRTEYTVQSVPVITSNLQSFYTPQTNTNVHELRYLDGSGVLTDQANAVWTARQVECTFPSP